ncbi:MAG: hypothetical protein LBP62_02575 [Clostridiales bacterium]|nr:hypothetical protein [Clostridiales bacterium]
MNGKFTFSQNVAPPLFFYNVAPPPCPLPRRGISALHALNEKFTFSQIVAPPPNPLPRRGICG